MLFDRRKPKAKTGRTFLVVVDDSEEMRAALHYASRRARACGGRVALLRVVPETEFHPFAFVGSLMQDEARAQAEQLLQDMAADVQESSGELPGLYVREGQTRDELLKLLREEPAISILVLAAGTGPDGPGPLVTALSGKYINRLAVPLTIVPGHLSKADLDAIT